jgi:hypothetical protein
MRLQHPRFLLPILLAAALAGCDEDGDLDDDDDDGDEAALVDPDSGARFDILSRADEPESAELLDALPSTRRSLEDGLAQAESDGFTISGKFEMSEDGAGGLSLSVYTARAGRDEIPEHNELVELAGDPTGAAWAPGAHVFEDYEHIARASQHLTLMAISPVTLDQVIRAASSEGTVYRVEPIVTDGRAAFEVLLATYDGAERLEVAPR